MKKIFLDATEMEHPLPLQKGTEALRQLDKESFFYMIHRKNPIPLIEMAKGYGLNILSEEYEGIWHILIAKNKDIDLKEYLDV